MLQWVPQQKFFLREVGYDASPLTQLAEATTDAIQGPTQEGMPPLSLGLSSSSSSFGSSSQDWSEEEEENDEEDQSRKNNEGESSEDDTASNNKIFVTKVEIVNGRIEETAPTFEEIVNQANLVKPLTSVLEGMIDQVFKELANQTMEEIVVEVTKEVL